MKRYLTLTFPILLVSALIQINVYAQYNFSPYNGGNPVVPKGGTGAWDENAVWAPHVIVENDTFYLTYNGTNDFSTDSIKIGIATSTDGDTFNKFSNPILTGDGSGFDAYLVVGGYLFYDQGIWYMYYSGRSTGPNRPGDVIGRAAALKPYGPWARSNDTLLTVGSAGEWDSFFIGVCNIIHTTTGLYMFYWGGNTPVSGNQIGLAISNDGGISWTKYDNPATTNPPYAESDPVLPTGQLGSFDDFTILSCSVLKTSNQWEMFYSGGDGDSVCICYATSNDGIVWDKNSIPILTPSQDPLATDKYEVPAFVVHNDNCFLYYDYGILVNGIGLATSAPNSINQIYNNHPDKFELKQNFPNPFNPITTIEFSIPKSEYVTLKIYNLLGQEVATLVSKNLKAGSYKYVWDAGTLASGVYLYKLQAGNFQQTLKMVYLK